MEIEKLIEYINSKGNLVKENTDFIKDDLSERINEISTNEKSYLINNSNSPFNIISNIYNKETLLYLLDIKDFNDLYVKIYDFIDEIHKTRYTIKDKIKIITLFNKISALMPKSRKGIPKCQEVVMFKPELNRLPLSMITNAYLHTYVPQKDYRNVEICDIQILNNEECLLKNNDFYNCLTHLYNSNEEKLPIAICIGGNPIYSLCASMQLPEYIDKYMFAAFLLNERVYMSDCLTQDIQIPSDCDIVIEGFLNKKDKDPIVHVTCITHKKEPYLPISLSMSNSINEQIDKILLQLSGLNEIEDIYYPINNHKSKIAIVKIRNDYPTQAFKIAHAFWGSNQMMLNKILIVTDNCDIRDSSSIEYAIKKYYYPKKDTLFSRGLGQSGKICIDATSKYKTIINDNQKNSLIKNDKGNKGDKGDKGDKSEFICGNLKILTNYKDLVSPNNLLDVLGIISENADPIKDSSFVKDNDNEILIIDASII